MKPILERAARHSADTLWASSVDDPDRDKVIRRRNELKAAGHDLPTCRKIINAEYAESQRG